MKEKAYYAARINLSSRADFVLFGANICIKKRLTDKQAKHAIQKAIAHQLLQGSDGKTLNFRYAPEKNDSFTIFVEVIPDGNLKRGNGQGSVYKLANGKWCAERTIGYDAAGLRKTKKKSGFHTKKEALAFLQSEKFAKSLARFACSLVNALSTAHSRCQLFARIQALKSHF